MGMKMHDGIADHEPVPYGPVDFEPMGMTMRVSPQGLVHEPEERNHE